MNNQEHGDNCSMGDYKVISESNTESKKSAEFSKDEMPDIDYIGRTISDLEFENGNG